MQQTRHVDYYLQFARLGFPLIGISGAARSGKDTIAHYLVREWGYTQLSFAEPLRLFVCGICGIDRADLDSVKEDVVEWIGKSPRQMLQTLGTEWGRGMVNENLWVLAGMQQALQLAERDSDYSVFSDVRFENEADAIRQRGGRIIHVARPDALQVAAHASEAGVPKQPGDFTIINDGTLDDLYTMVNEVMARL